ncbi:MAG: GerAB/ArcD/ProY family transporter [Clostridia bacterium]|nr:GerAB/ArcD/ProY family transporter [Clostridia bacterium]
MKNIRLTTFEVVSTLSIIGLGPILLSYPQNAAKEFGSATVLHYLYISILVFIFATILYKLYKPFEGKNIFDISNFLGGKTLESIFGTLLATYLFILSVSTIHEFGQDIKNMMFPNSLVSEINLFLTIGILLGIYTGIRGLFRTGRNNILTTINWFGVNVCSFI